jgi:diaminopropionate ammonia-lyase
MDLQRWYARDARVWTCDPPDGSAVGFHRGLPGYAPTPLAEAPELAAELGVGRLFVKDESARFDLRAFKYLGASWAGYRAVALLTGYAGPAGLAGLTELAGLAGLTEPSGLARLTEPSGLAGLAVHLKAAGVAPALVTATDGNHGRAVARTARLLGLPARVYVPNVVPGQAIDRITAEGAQVTVVDGDYDEAVAAARDDAALANTGPANPGPANPGQASTGLPSAAGSAGAVLVQDTAWPGYEQVPAWIVAGYETLFAEIDAQLAAAGAARGADLVSVPTGVGSLAQAAVAHYRSSAALSRPRLLSVEPDTAACVLASLRAGAPVTVPTAATVMNGLNCGTPSTLAWPYLLGGLDAGIAVTDTEADDAVASLRRSGVTAGPSGAASFAGVRAALTGPGADARRRDLGLGGRDGQEGDGAPVTVVCICTEGPLSDGL